MPKQLRADELTSKTHRFAVMVPTKEWKRILELAEARHPGEALSITLRRIVQQGYTAVKEGRI